MKSSAFFLMLAVGVGISIGSLVVARLASDDPQHEAGVLAERLTRGESSELDPEHVAQALDSLTQVMDNEINERRVLADQLDELRTEMAELREFLRVEARSAASLQPEAQVDRTIEGRLAAAGFTPQKIESIRRRWAEGEMRMMELDDQARREGWLNTPRYFQEVISFASGSNTVRRYLGDDAYDRYLFASDRPNRATVSAVIETSPAEQAGLQPGDVIKSYGGERVFSPQQLLNLRSTGDKGLSVAVEIIRNGQPMQITMPRGPMGVKTRFDAVDPSAPGGG